MSQQMRIFFKTVPFFQKATIKLLLSLNLFQKFVIAGRYGRFQKLIIIKNM